MGRREYACLSEHFIARLYEEEYLCLSGQKATLETEGIYEEYAPLFTREAVAERLGDRGDREGEYLAEFAVHGYLERQLRGLTEEIANAESAAEVEWKGERLPFRRAWGEVTTEADRERRRGLERAVAAVVADHNGQRKRRVARRRELSQELGFRSYRALCEELSGQALGKLGEEMAALLDATEEGYRERVSAAFEEAGLDPGEATNGDLRWVILGPRFKDVFSRERLVPAAEVTLRHLGIALEKQHNVKLDLDLRPNKYPRPFCSPVAVPGDLRVVAAPRGGVVDWLSFFHELGHAEHFAHVRADLPVAYRLMGDDAVWEGFAFGLQSVVLCPEWLRRVMGLDAPPPGLMEMGELLELLWYVRRSAGKLLYELELYDADEVEEEMGSRYAEVLGRALAVRVAPEHSLFDMDDRLFYACYLRALMFEAGLRKDLQRRFGETWYFSAEAGEWLRALWSRGTEQRAEEMAEELGMEFGLEVLEQRLLHQPK